MTDPHKQMGRVLSRARADLDDINRRGEGHFQPVTRKLTEAELRAVMPEPWVEPDPSPWPLFWLLCAVALIGIAIGYGVQSLWLGGM